MTVKALIAELQKQNPDAPVELEVLEPYDDEPATVYDMAAGVSAEKNGYITIHGAKRL